MKIKVCGITMMEQANALAEMGVEYIGFIGYDKSSRYAWNALTPKDLYNFDKAKKVGVFVNENVDKVLQIANEAKLNFIQLHGNEPIQEVETIAKEFKVIKAISVGNDARKIQEMIDRYQSFVSYLLFDTATKNYGGSGKSFHWSILDNVHFTKPYFLSGGLSLQTPLEFNHIKNKPYALDINSRFETRAGVKDLNLVRAFTQQVKKLKNSTHE